VRDRQSLDPDLNVIVITGYPDSEILDRILQISPVTVLKKPLKIEQLNQTVKILGHTTAKVEPYAMRGDRSALNVRRRRMTHRQFCCGGQTRKKSFRGGINSPPEQASCLGNVRLGPLSLNRRQIQRKKL
jgi:hypothetical protein